MNRNQFKPISIFTRQNIIEDPNFNINYNLKCKAKGLCNQLFALCKGIIDAKKQQKKFIIVDSFLSCIHTGKLLPLSKILNLKVTSSNLNIVIIDRNSLDIECISGKYGHIDVTYYFKKKFNITINDNINKIFGDPSPGKFKELKLEFNLSNYILKYKIDEKHNNLTKNIWFNKEILSKNIWNNVVSSFCWYTNFDENMLHHILKNLKFVDDFYKIVEEMKKEIGEKVNIVHFRLEDDGLRHWSKQNGLSIMKFKHKLLNSYDKFVNRLQKKSKIYFLTDCTKELNRYSNDYIIVNTNKLVKIKNNLNIDGREIRAIIDLLYSIQCDGIFIGCHNLKLKRGSSFSYTINVLGKFKERYFIDLDKI